MNSTELAKKIANGLLGEEKMTQEEEDKVFKLLFAVASVCGSLACIIEDEDLAMWFSISAKETRERLMKATDEFVVSMGWR